MTTETSRLTLAVDTTQVRRASTDLDRFGAAGRRSETAVQSLSRQFSLLRGTFAGIGSGLAVRAIIQAADSYSNLNARLRLVTRSATEFAEAQRSVFSIAQQTRAGFEQTADLFGNLSRATESLGVNQRDVLQVTETINQAIAVSGTSAQGAAAALVQLGQGFAAGALRGEELNSVLEQAPRLARAIADGLGVPIGKLRELGEEGRLTADAVFNALRGSSDRIASEFRQLPLTVGAATTQAANALIKLIGTIDATSGATRGLSGAISDAADFISELADEIEKLRQGQESASLLAQAFVTISQTLQVLGANVAFVFKGIGREIGAIAAQAAALARLDFAGFRAISEAVREDGVRARRELDALERRILGLSRVTIVSSDQDPRRGRGFVAAAPVAPVALPEPAPRRQRAQTVSEAERYLETLRKQLQSTKDLSVAETVLADIQAGRLGKVTASQQAVLLDVARQIDAANQLRDQLEAEQQQFEEYTAARKRAADEGRRVFEETRTPAERLAAEIDRLNGLLSQGVINWDTYSRAIFDAQDAFEQTQKTLVEKSTDIKQLADDLGLAFSSAFENAIVSGGGLRDLLRGLEEDIIRLVTRQLVTKPLANAVGGALEGILGGSSGGGVIGSLSGFFSGLFGGARATGGAIQRGRVYEINEGGVGEIANIGGRQFLLANQSGSIERQKSQAGGVSVVVNQSFARGTDYRTVQEAAAATGAAVQRALARNR